MFGTIAGYAAGQNLPALGNVSFQFAGIFVVNYTVFSTEYADFFPSAHAAFSLGKVGFFISIVSHDYAS
jgi:hypothetical protein